MNSHVGRVLFGLVRGIQGLCGGKVAETETNETRLFFAAKQFRYVLQIEIIQLCLLRKCKMKRNIRSGPITLNDNGNNQHHYQRARTKT